MYNANLNYVRSVLGNKTTDSEQLNVFGKDEIPMYIGAFPFDMLPKLENGQSAIINQDSSRGGGIHWVAVHQSGGKLYGFDSFNRKINRFVPIRRRIDDGAVQKSVKQKMRETDCGQRSLAWLMTVDDIGITKANIL